MRDGRCGVSGGDVRKEVKLRVMLSVCKETGTQASRLWGSILVLQT